MKEPAGPSGLPARSRFRLELGLDVLGAWADGAGGRAKNEVYEALFAMVDGSLFRDYRIIDDFRWPSEMFVIVRDDLVLKLRINCFDSFGILFIGPCDEACVDGRTRRAA